jgi:uncharacterized protein (TIGR02271 family)
MTEVEKDDLPSDSVNGSVEVTIPVIEEFVQAGKKNITTGKIRIDKKIKEEEVEVEMALEHDELVVDRVPINKFVEDTPPAFRQEGETTIIPVLREVYEKRLLLVEELRLTKRKLLGKEKQKVILRKEVVTVERTDNDASDNRN